MFPKQKTILTGLPLREEAFKINTQSKYFDLDKKRPIIYVTGGNQGAHFINIAIEEVLEELLKTFTIIHQTGESQKFNDYERLSKRQTQFYKTEGFIGPKDIGTVFHKASFVIGRAGANTVSELAALLKPAILIPIPWASGDEQKKNAKLLEEMGLAKILDQDNLTPRELLSETRIFWQNIEKYKTVKPFDSELQKNATDNLYKIINEIANR
jgi:UDP-N-acetylglucosamine--N-acetylmuramyl-(pentapeptide) pyrophosphoryl-undecaprenol N-acetylglucosamine transferase